MEHRWGNRVSVDIGVRISARVGIIGVGRILDISVSGAWIRTRLDLSALSRVMLAFDPIPVLKHEGSSVGAYVTRTSREGFGVEWYELDPPFLSELLPFHALRTIAGSGVLEYSNSSTPPNVRQ